MNNETRTEFLDLIAAHPDLHLRGYGFGNTVPDDFDASRAELSHPYRLETALDASEWCAARLKAHKPKPAWDRSGYHWKHIMERETGNYTYVGPFLLGALHAGLPVTFNHLNGTIHARLAR